MPRRPAESRHRVIVDEILEDDAGKLQLRFYAYVGLVDGAAGSEKEREAQAALHGPDRGYRAALISTLARTRALVKEGKLDPCPLRTRRSGIRCRIARVTTRPRCAAA